MTTLFARPRIVVSHCIELDHGRGNGVRISSDVVKLLRPQVTFVPVFPEMGIGLGVPRPAIRVIEVEAAERA